MTKFWLYTFLLFKPSDEKKILHFVKQHDIEVISISKTHTSDGITLELFIAHSALIHLLEEASETSSLLTSKKEVCQEVNWLEQAELFAPQLVDGYILITLSNNTQFRLLPGNAFGDASHPTTLLILEQLAAYVKGKTVFDIGTGSGILAIGAALLGARQVFAVEIDPLAVEVAEKNILLNSLQNKVTLGKETSALGQYLKQKKELVIVANMISCEMQHIFLEYAPFFQLPGIALLSGILKSEKNKFTTLLKQKNWHVLEEHEKENWISLTCQRDLL